MQLLSVCSCSRILHRPVMSPARFDSLVCARQDHSADAIGHLHFMKIDEQSKRHIQQLHVAEKLGFVDGQNLLNCLHFNQDTGLDQYVEAKWSIAAGWAALN